MKVLVIVGTRPEGIKMAPIIRHLRLHYPDVQTIVCSTGQHREMLKQVFALFDIIPDHDLNLMQHNQTPTQVAARVLLALEPLLVKHNPDWMLVQGDTTTVVAASLAAHYHKVRVGHVEAGLRSFNRDNPFPEEMNRVVTDHISDVHFAPTETARACLLAEGIPATGIHVTGNTVIDALLWAAEQSSYTGLSDSILSILQDEKLSPVLVTAHRRENHGRPIRNICIALRNIVEQRPDVRIVYPVHLNPNIWEPVHELLADSPAIFLIPPVDYMTLAHLMRFSRLILTDSGGIQEEAPSLGVPVLVMRETTERPEAINAGVARLIGTDSTNITQEVLRLLDDDDMYRSMSQPVNPYGDGLAAKRITDALIHGFCESFVPQLVPDKEYAD